MVLLALGQRFPTTFDLPAILQKCENSQVTSNKMVHWTTDSQHLNLKKGR